MNIVFMQAINHDASLKEINILCKIPQSLEKKIATGTKHSFFPSLILFSKGTACKWCKFFSL